jgi:hypothetical protein
MATVSRPCAVVRSISFRSGFLGLRNFRVGLLGKWGLLASFF